MSEKKTIRKSTEKKPNPKINEKKKDNQQRLDPVRYGDWEKNGRCIDF